MAEATKTLVCSNNTLNQPNIYKVKNSKAKKYLKKKNKTLIKTLYSLFTLVFIASAIFILSNYQKITALNFEIRKVNAIIVEAEKTQMNLTASIENIKSRKDIVQEAQTKLGMVYPESDQVVYFTLEDGVTPKSEENFVSSIFSTITGFNK